MTALAGFWPLADPSGGDKSCQAMLAAQRSYGPDASDWIPHEPMWLGRNLFALLPEDEFDRQPIVAGGGRFSLVADIRLDNRSELASSLGIGAVEARKLADSAILALSLERWGEAALERLLGDFAFAWFDLGERELMLARDPLGQRPLFWSRQRDFIAFASMPKGLHALEVDRFPDDDAVLKFLADAPRDPGQCYFGGIRRVPPGHLVRVSAAGETSRRYWEPRREPLRLGSFDAYVEAYRGELDRAVGSRLRTRSGPVAAHLSGGWDSGAVAATAARLSTQAIPAFTAVPEGGAAAGAPRGYFADEAPLARAIASMHGNIQHHVIAGDGGSPIDQLENGARWFERPLFNVCNHGWLAQIREAARATGAQVLLSGEIGNWTISAGSVTLLAEYSRKFGWAAWWRAARNLERTTPARWRGLLAATFGTSRHSSARPLVHPHSLDGVARMGGRRDYFETSGDAFNAMDFGEHRKGILGGWGIDKRDPTADTRLIEFCLSLPIEMLLAQSARRPLAKAALSDRLPAAVLEARGKGYQGAQWHSSLSRDICRVEALVDEIADDDRASRTIDTDRLRHLLRSWPSAGANDRATIATYRNRFLQALTAGHFLIRAAGRDIADDPSRR